MNWSIPLGVEVLVKKAAVDPAFRTLLLACRAEAASHIELALQPAEAAMLAAVPQAQLEAIIDRTTVPQEHRREFLGKAAAAMLAALGAMAPGAAASAEAVKFHSVSGGMRIDVPPAGASTETEVCNAMADVLDRDPTQIHPETNLKTDLKMTPEQFEAVDQALEAELHLPLPLDAIRESETVGDVVDLCETTRRVRQALTDALSRRLGRPADTIAAEQSLADDLDATPAQLVAVRRQLAQQLRVHLDWNTFRQQKTVGDLVELVAGAVRLRQQKPERPDPPPTRGIQSDMPMSFGIQPGMPSQRLPSQSVRPRQPPPPPRGLGGIRP